MRKRLSPAVARDHRLLCRRLGWELVAQRGKFAVTSADDGLAVMSRLIAASERALLQEGLPPTVTLPPSSPRSQKRDPKTTGTGSARSQSKPWLQSAEQAAMTLPAPFGARAHHVMAAAPALHNVRNAPITETSVEPAHATGPSLARLRTDLGRQARPIAVRVVPRTSANVPVRQVPQLIERQRRGGD